MKNLGVPGDFAESRKGWDKQGGDYIEYIYEGNLNYIYSLYNIGISSGFDSVEMSHRGPLYTLRLRQNSPDINRETPIDSVRMSVNRVHKDIFEPPSATNLTSEELKEVKDALEDTGTDLPTLVLGWSNDQIDLYNLALAGVKYRIVYQPVITRTKTASRRFDFIDPYANVGSVLTEAGMIADAELQGLIRFQIPSYTLTLPTGFQYGWLKHMPNYDEAIGARVVETREYEYGAWAEAEYVFV
jgi:hypothetical protein